MENRKSVIHTIEIGTLNTLIFISRVFYAQLRWHTWDYCEFIVSVYISITIFFTFRWWVCMCFFDIVLNLSRCIASLFGKPFWQDAHFQMQTLLYVENSQCSFSICILMRFAWERKHFYNVIYNGNILYKTHIRLLDRRFDPIEIAYWNKFK